MDWKSAIEEERAGLMRLVALLFSLANLADSASGRSALVRAFVVWVLRRAETVAQDLVFGEEARSSMSDGPAGNHPAEALRLAQSFRILARELEDQARLAFAVEGCVEHVSETRSRACRQLADLLNALPQLALGGMSSRPACAAGPPDTS